MNSYLYADAPPLRVVGILFFPYTPPISSQVFTRLNDHVADELSLFHQCGAEGVSTRP